MSQRIARTVTGDTYWMSPSFSSIISYSNKWLKDVMRSKHIIVTISLNSGTLWKSSPVIYSTSSCRSFRVSRRPMLISADRARACFELWCPVVLYGSDTCCQNAWQLFKNGSLCCCQFIEQFILPGALMRFIYSSAPWAACLTYYGPHLQTPPITAITDG